MLNIALTGLPGAGKSTSSSLFIGELAKRGFEPQVVKLAAPLYDVQASFYSRMNSALPEGQQDGQLLNFLGGHYRKASPTFLVRDLAWRCDAARIRGAKAVICDDARPLDLDDLRALGFKIMRITVPEDLRVARKKARGDKFAGRDDHPSELAAQSGLPPADFIIDNSGNLEDLAAKVKQAVDSIEGASLGNTTPNGSTSYLGPAAEELFARARELITSRYAVNRHQIAAALLTGDGRVFTGLHIEAMVGRASICAEAVALAKAREAGTKDISLAVALRHPRPTETTDRIRIVPPCGLCRELLLDYGANAHALIEVDGQIQSVSLRDMLPHKYMGTKWS